MTVTQGKDGGFTLKRSFLGGIELGNNGPGMNHFPMFRRTPRPDPSEKFSANGVPTPGRRDANRRAVRRVEARHRGRARKACSLERGLGRCRVRLSTRGRNRGGP